MEAWAELQMGMDLTRQQLYEINGNLIDLQVTLGQGFRLLAAAQIASALMTGAEITPTRKEDFEWILKIADGLRDAAARREQDAYDEAEAG